jgi:glycosyltransferase involved in cell wall biosynthesis
MRFILIAAFHPAEKIGGAEYQTLLIAQGLAALGHDVIFLATDSTKEEVFEAGTITVKKVPGWHTVGWARHRRFLTRAIEWEAADACYVRAFTELASVVPICRKAGVPVVSVSCSARETSPFLFGHHPIETIRYLRSLQAFRHLYSFFSIRSSAAHVSNTKSLQRRVQRWFPRKRMWMIYNGSPIPPPGNVHRKPSGQVIWVNNLKRLKQPEVYVQLARRLLQFRFLMIGRMPEGRYGKRVKSVLGQAPANLHYLGPMPIEQVNFLIGQSDLLLYTSLPVEGFGNSFLQAWFRGVPTVSLSFDLDGILEREAVGRCPQTFEQLVADVEELMRDDATRLEMGRSAREYAIRHHSAEKMVADYEALFEEVVQGMRRGAPSG